MNMSEDFELLNRKICHILDQGTDKLDAGIAAKLSQARGMAIDRYGRHVAVARNPRLALTNGDVTHGWFRRARAAVMMLALGLGAVGTYYWNGLEQAQEHVEIDSELLSDDLPPSAYIDPGFQEWLDTTSHFSSPRD